MQTKPIKQNKKKNKYQDISIINLKQIKFWHKIKTRRAPEGITATISTGLVCYVIKIHSKR